MMPALSTVTGLHRRLGEIEPRERKRRHDRCSRFSPQRHRHRHRHRPRYGARYLSTQRSSRHRLASTMAAPVAAIQKALEDSLATVAKAVEDQLDDELAKLDNLEDDDLEKLRERRIQQMKKQATMRQQWLAQGHGDYQEIFSEKDFFAKVKTSDRVVCHFYRENWPCKVMDKHLLELTKQHLETKFLKINAEKSPFLTERLKIFMLPTLALVKKGKVEEYVVGFDELGGKDDFSTEELEDRLAKSGVIHGPEGRLTRPVASQAKRSVRQGSSSYGGNSDDED